MPARRLQNDLGKFAKYDAAGQDSDTAREFVRHIGLCGESSGSISVQKQVSLVHMGPPLTREAKGHPVQSIGTADLTVDQVRQVDVFVDELMSEYKAEQLRARKQYVIHPHVVEPDENIPCRRFSCSGFVIEAYRDAGIELVDVHRVPKIPIEMLHNAYPDAASLLDNEKFRSEHGLTGSGPWPVVLAGYVMNSLDRTVEEIRASPFLPTNGDEFFPSNRVRGG